MSVQGEGSAARCSLCGNMGHEHGACGTSAGARVGAVLEGKYELNRLVGHGGMGEVYEGRHRAIGRRVAVKFLHAEYARHPDIAARFENEARAAGGSEHENLAGVYDVGCLPDGTRYLVMEFLDGEDVDKLVRREAPLPVARAASIVIQACRGLDVVHRRDIIHRDLKPSNLFLTKRVDNTDLVKIIDFGIAKLRTSDGRAATKSGAAIGTAHYMAPEQARGERTIDHRSDIYSLGVILYEVLSGKRPHEGDSVLAVLHNVMTKAPVPLESIRPGLPHALYTTVKKAMAFERANRFESAADLGNALLVFAGRAIPPIRSQSARTGSFAREADETRASAESTIDRVAPPVGRSMAGVARTQPNAFDATDRRRKSRFAILALGVGGLALGGMAVAGVRALGSGAVARIAPSEGSAAQLRTAPTASSTLGSGDPATTLIAAGRLPSDAGMVSPVIAGGFAPTAPAAARPPPPTLASAGLARATTIPSGRPTGSSEHAGASSSAPAPVPLATSRPAAESSPSTGAPVPGPPPVPTPTATDRGANPF